MIWGDRFVASRLVKGEKPAYVPCLLSQADKALLDRLAASVGLKPGVMAARLLSEVVRQNSHRAGGFE